MANRGRPKKKVSQPEVVETPEIIETPIEDTIVEDAVVETTEPTVVAEVIEEKTELPAVVKETPAVAVETKEKEIEQPTTKKKSNIKENWNKTKDWFSNHKLVYRLLQVTLCIFLFIGANVAVSALTYFGYIQTKYYRIEDGEELSVERNRVWYVTTTKKYTALTMDIGSSIQVPQYSSINATGKMKDGTKTQGEYNYGIDETTVTDNIIALKQYVRSLDMDFYTFQEVDVASTRSYMVNQYEHLNESLARYSRIASRYQHTQYLVYPFKNPIGLINSDLMTYCRYKTTYGLREQLPIDVNFTSRLASADNAMSVAFLPINGMSGNYLVLINVNLDADAEVRKQQMEVINEFVQIEYDDGNFVIISGNFNSDTATVDGTFANEQQTPTWLTDFDESLLLDTFKFVHPTNETELANYRSTDIPYEKGVNYEAHTSGFIVSDNIEAEAVIIDTEYMYSNHNPVQLTFKLIKPKK